MENKELEEFKKSLWQYAIEKSEYKEGNKDYLALDLLDKFLRGAR